MADAFKPGDQVEWDTSQGTTEGTVERRLTGETHIKGFTAKPSAENPEYLVKSAKTGAEAAHKPSELRKRGGARKATKAAGRKTPAKGARKSAAKKSAAKRSTATQATVRKTAATQGAAKKTAAKRTTAKRATAKRTTAKRTTAKRATAKKAGARKAASTRRRR